MELTPSQRQAVETIDHHLQIIACAGSGKTQVVSQRIVNILKTNQGKITPANIVAFTYTDKAAAELKDRIHRLCGEQLGTVRGLSEMFAGTMHSFCLNLLQTYLYDFLKYTPLNEVQQRLFVDRANVKTGLSDLGLKRWSDSRLYLNVLGIIREAHILNEKLLRKHPIRTALQKYEKELHERAYLDYTMMIREAVNALDPTKGNEELRKKLAERIKFLVVDEYQDINPLQECLIRMITELGANLCVVGDDDQTIYQWRGTDVENILRFDKRYPVTCPPGTGPGSVLQ